MTWELIAVNVCGYAIALSLLMLIWRKTGDYLTFAQVFSLFWGLCILSAQIPPATVAAPDLITILILFVAWWAFLLGALLVLAKPLPRYVPCYDLNKKRALMALWSLVGLHAVAWWVGLPDFDRFDFTSWSNVVSGLADLRVRHGLKTEMPWFLQFVGSGFIYYFPLAVLLLRKGWISRSGLSVIVLMGVFMSLTRFSRAPFLWAAVVLLFSWKLVYKPKAKAVVLTSLIAAAVFIGVFFWMQIILVGSTWSVQGVYAILDGYWGGSMRAYSTIVHGEYPRYEYGLYSLDAINWALAKLGLISGYPELVRNYGTNATNLYTFLDAYTLDFGIFGAFAGAFVTGIIVAVAYRMVKIYFRLSTLVMYATLTFFCAMSTANNEFIRNTIPMMLVFGIAVDLLITVRKPRFVGVLTLTPHWPTGLHQRKRSISEL